MGIKIWVDDIRPKPSEFQIRFKSVHDTLCFLRGMLVNKSIDDIEMMSLDHDAGEYYEDGGDYINILDWMAEHDVKIPCYLHTGNPVGRDNMRRLMKRYGIPEVKYEFN